MRLRVNKNEANPGEPRAAVETRVQRIIGFYAKRMFTTCIRCTLMQEVNILFCVLIVLVGGEVCSPLPVVLVCNFIHVKNKLK